jgi:predicted aldo/keto reductase-like oxidoreductase
MERISLGSTGLRVSPLGMGVIQIGRRPWDESIEVVRGVLDLGVNWFDTARAYGDTELRLGEALAGIRDQAIIMSKSHAHDPDTFRTHIDESLARLQTDYPDVLFFHGGGAIDEECFFAAGGMLEIAEGAVQAGKIRHLGFSAHRVELALKALEIPSMAVAMVPANFISREFIDGDFLTEAQARGVAVVAMKPFGGGRISNASLCLRFLKTYPGLLPCPGIEHASEMAENIRVWEEGAPLTDGDVTEMERIRELLGDRFCRGCGYCQPCPEGVPISTVAFAGIFSKQFTRDRVIEVLAEPVEQARACVECRECVEKCPYDLNIPQMIRENIAFFEALSQPL